jgi:hypothetical protein
MNIDTFSTQIHGCQCQAKEEQVFVWLAGTL